MCRVSKVGALCDGLSFVAGFGCFKLSQKKTDDSRIQVAAGTAGFAGSRIILGAITNKIENCIIKKQVERMEAELDERYPMNADFTDFFENDEEDSEDEDDEDESESSDSNNEDSETEVKEEYHEDVSEDEEKHSISEEEPVKTDEEIADEAFEKAKEENQQRPLSKREKIEKRAAKKAKMNAAKSTKEYVIPE